MIIKIIFSLLFLASFSFSEDLSKKEILNTLSTNLNISNTSQLENTLSGNHYSSNKENKSVFKHFRFKEGIDLPSADKSQVKSPKFEITSEARLLAFQLSEESATEAMKEFNVEKKLPNCSSNNSEIINLANAKDKRIKIDMLFIAKEKLQKIDPALFGSATRVSLYNYKKASHVYAANNFNFNCLPSRVRASYEMIAIHSGLDALKNYDLNKAGKMAPEVMRILN